MNIALIIGHPDLAASRVNAALLAAVEHEAGVHARILERLHPDGLTAADVAAEQAALEAADEIVLQYPTYWYSTPALLKTWLDQVMVAPWAYGPGVPGRLAGKRLRVVTTTGGVEAGYRDDGLHGWEYDAVLVPLRMLARRLGMIWAEPLVVHGVRDLTYDDLAAYGGRYRALLRDDVEVAA